MNKLIIPETLPLKLKSNRNTSSLYIPSAYAVAVQYWVLRPSEKDYT